MEYIPKNDLLQQREDSLFQIRKIYNLHNPERLKESIDILEEWVKKQTHFLKRDFPREYYERTLISCKGSVEKSKRTIDRLCTMRTLMPKFFSITNVKIELKEVLDIAWLFPLPKMTHDYLRVLLLKINSKNFETRHFLQYFQYNVVLCEYIKRNDFANGFIVIEDFRHVNLVELMTKINLVELQQFLTIIIEGFGARLQGVYMLSESKTIELLINTVKQFVSEKIGKRLQIVSNYEDLFDLVPKEYIPEDYGGTEKSTNILTEKWMEVLSSDDTVEYLKMMNKAGTDESLRLVEKFNEDYMGMPGSFRSLTVD